MTERKTAGVPSFEKTKTPTPFGLIVFKSVAVLAVLGLIFFAIYWSFGRMAFQNHTREELFGQVMRSQADVRRLAALSWSAKLQVADSQSKLEDLRDYLPLDEQSTALAQELKSLEAAARPDSELVAGILGVLGHSYSARAQQALRDFLRTPRVGDWSGPEIQAVAGLSRRAPENDETLEIFRDLIARSGDAAVRKTIAYGLGFSEEGGTGEDAWAKKSAMLETLLQDPASDVRWNAAFSALRLGISLPAAEKQVADLIAELAADLETSAFGRDRESAVVQKRETYFAALDLASKLESNGNLWSKVQMQIRDIADRHLDLKIRQAAKVTLGNKMPDREKRR